MNTKKILNEIYEALVVSKCPVCGEIVRYSGNLCDECLEKYVKEREATCPFCEMTASVCVCSTRSLDFCPRLGRGMYAALFYGKKFPTVSKLIFSLKQDADRNSERFLADMMAKRILNLIEQAGERADDWCITYPPRSRRSTVKFGFDHSKQLAKSISHLTGMKFENVFIHSGKAHQKELDRKERIKNARKAFYLRKNADVKGKSYIIIDDIITSGATMKRCQVLLQKHGAAAAFPVCIAKTVRRGEGFDRENKKHPRQKKSSVTPRRKREEPRQDRRENQ